ncbi:predicted protein [Naegleria gruberi]|uniref:ER membrane protein complex subunit 3 n=1 Tax=Naegleria gruberi TaxID=5762 RepID=D2VIZ3_NAEGR|nr:uncharacterized protein NAEGRDRAFT_68850 [Naegleria gruberi]EFC43110.1 predicted protein [Naegleria gruberi]|eukprot:XP_002675854.1 predicted protein [Naegleria gruberi strain NEG-M]
MSFILHHPSTLVIDSAIRDWVLLPIVAFILLFSILRHYASIYFKSNKEPPVDKFTHFQTLTKGQILGRNFNFIPLQSFLTRKAFFNREKDGEFRKKIENNPLTAMADPNNMTEMMKNNVQTMVPNLVMFGWIYFFYAGFVIAKFPFPLSDRFRAMVQRGIELQSLETSYVTSASMYFLILFGVKGVLSLLLGENVADEAQLMANSNPLTMGQMGATPGANPMLMVDFGKAFESEKDNLELIQHTHEPLNESESALLAKWKTQ